MRTKLLLQPLRITFFKSFPEYAMNARVSNQEKRASLVTLNSTAILCAAFITNPFISPLRHPNIQLCCVCARIKWKARRL